jgi:hypothetical protein
MLLVEKRHVVTRLERLALRLSSVRAVDREPSPGRE